MGKIFSKTAIKTTMDVELAIALVGQAPTPQQAFECFQQNSELLKEHKFVIRGTLGTQPSHAFDREFSHGAGVHTLFSGSRVVVLDERIARETAAGDVQFHFDYSIALDTQAVSYLHPYTCGRDPAISNPDLQAVFDLIAGPDVWVDPLPYLLENLDQVGVSPRIDSKILEKLKAYEILRTIDSSALADGQVKSIHSDGEIVDRSSKLFDSMKLQATPAGGVHAVARQYQFFHACMLAIVDAYFDPDLGASEKLLAVADFCDQELAAMAGRELQLGHWLFSKSEIPEFFRKLKHMNIDSVRNMTWDIFHLRRMEKLYAIDIDSKADFFFPAMLTFDKALREVIDLHPLRAIAWSTRNRSPITFYEKDPIEQMFPLEHEGAAFATR